MKLRSITLKNIRNHPEISLALSSDVTIIHGDNGTGKTSILEAIYLTLRGISFRGVDRDILRRDSAWYRVDIETDDVLVSAAFSTEGSGQKFFQVNDHKTVRLPMKYRYPVILFTPDDLRLIDGSPARRRKYLDTVIAQFDQQYARHIRRYERALAQRNKLLKLPVASDALFSWDVILSDSGSYIIAARQAFIERLNQSINVYYGQISGANDTVSVRYSIEGLVSSQQLLHTYEQSLGRDRHLQYTSHGPHRHDFTVLLNNESAEDTASRGEVRTLILALKYIEVDIIREKLGLVPIMLLDDVFGELDEGRQQNLLKKLTGLQIIITSTHPVPQAGASHVALPSSSEAIGH